MSQTRKYLTLGLGHGINDCIAGFIVGSLFYHNYSSLELGIYTLIYNLIAFGGQLAFAKILETIFMPKKYLIGAFLLLVASLGFLNFSPKLAILFSGIASAVIHVTGGVESIRKDGKAFGIGIFASPGVVGLIVGGYLAYKRIDFILPAIGMCLSYLILLMISYKPSPNYLKPEIEEPLVERHDVLMIILLTAISLRSFIWDVFQMVKQENYNWLIVVAIAAMFGKLIGSFLADKIGHVKYSIIALCLSLPFLTILKKNIVTLGIGVSLLQSTIPATTAMLVKLMRQKPAIAVSISFGLSVFIAIVLFYTPAIQYINNNALIFFTLLASTLLLLLFNKLSKKGRYVSK
ncbi:MAG: hypothetical protein H6607_07535 [Flavobacteriales bacterium]|nr:hypothetical protein [Flavobacteriales bacterium]